MPYFKWKAYDHNLKYYEGAIECERYELVAIEIERKGLWVSSIETTDYTQYKHVKTAEKHMKKLEKVKNKYKHKNQDITFIEYNKRTNRISPKIYQIIIIAIGISVLMLLVYFSGHQ